MKVFVKTLTITMLSRCSREKQQQKKVQQSLVHVQILFFANSYIYIYIYFLPFSVPSTFNITHIILCVNKPL